MESTLFQQSSILYIDHLAVTTADFEGTLADYLGMPGARLVRGPALNPDQNVQYAFIQLSKGLTVEILGIQQGSPVSRHVSQGGGPYHFCFAVADLAASINAAEQLGAKVVTPPIADVAFDGRRIAFLVHERHGLFEFVEAYPATAGRSKTGGSVVRTTVPDTQPVARAVTVGTRLAGVVRTVFPETEEQQMSSAALNNTPGWDSLGHIRFMMAVEAEFEVNIPAARIPELASFEQIRAYLDNSLHMEQL